MNIQLQATAVRGPARRVVGTLEEVDFIRSTDDVNAGRVIMTCAKLIAESTAEDSSLQLCAYMASIIVAVFMDVEAEAVEALHGLGAKVNIRELPRDFPITAIALESRADPGVSMLVFAQAVLILFKNIGTDSYETFMRNRINAMRNLIGVDPEQTELRAFDFHKATLFHTRVRSCTVLRIAVVETILSEAHNTDRLGKLCSYLTTILAWTEMTALTFIVDALLINKSPVLYDERVRTEVKALAEAFTEINQFEYPQFYRIMKSPLECKKLLERSRFPILLAVACELRSQVHPSARNYVVNQSNANTVAELVALHTNSTRGLPNAVDRMVAFLTDFSDERYDVTDAQPGRDASHT